MSKIIAPLFTFIFCLTFTAQTQAQTQKETLRIEEKGIFIKYYQGDEKIRYREYLKVLAADPTCSEHVAKIKQHQFWGSAISFTGSMITVIGAFTTNEYNAATFTYETNYNGLSLMAAGIAISCAAYPIITMQMKELKKATDVYNGVSTSQAHTFIQEMRLGAGQNGLSLTMSF
ncbi:MAG: hypothetical protein AAFW00_00330 [Bacteroidota bacterium]